jgi:hypothetical protein
MLHSPGLVDVLHEMIIVVSVGTVKMMKLSKYFSGFNRLPSRHRYKLVILLTWIYAAVWAGLIVSVNSLWNVSMIWRVLITIILVICTPTIKDLFLSYDDYLEEQKKITSARSDITDIGPETQNRTNDSH